MQRLCFSVLLGILVLSCKPEAQENVTDAVAAYELNQKEWPKKVAMDFKIQPDLANWMEFAMLETSFDALYTVENEDDLILVINDLVEKEKVLAEASYPEKFDMPQIKGRLTLFKTFLLKVKGDLHYRLDVQQSTLEMVDSYNAFRNQFNIIANNTLDTDLLLEE